MTNGFQRICKEHAPYETDKERMRNGKNVFIPYEERRCTAQVTERRYKAGHTGPPYEERIKHRLCVDIRYTYALHALDVRFACGIYVPGTLIYGGVRFIR